MEINFEKPKEEEKVNETKTLELEDASYEGQALDDLPHGKGTKKWKNGATYDGEFVKGIKEGTGEWKKNGQSYIGQFKNDKFNGRGVLRWPNG